MKDMGKYQDMAVDMDTLDDKMLRTSAVLKVMVKDMI